jgi:hypothetical protein
MRVVLYWEDSKEQAMAVGLIGPMRRWMRPLVNAIWQGSGTPDIEITAHPQIFNVDDNAGYVEALERAVFCD